MDKSAKIRRAFALLTLLCVTICVSAQCNHFVTNYSQGPLAKEAQTWQVACYTDDWVFFANRDGMNQFNGDSWENYRMANGIDCRSVYVSHETGRIYVGGINEYGYYTTDNRGMMNYTSLIAPYGKRGSEIGNVWGIFEAGKDVYALGDNKIHKISGSRHSIIETGLKIDCSNYINDVLYVGTENGLYVLMGKKILPANGSALLQGKRIRGIYPFKSGILVFTASSGIYYYNGIATSPVATGYDAFIAKNEAFCAAVRGDTIAVGTIQSGLMVLNLKTGKAEFYNEANGLQDNTVLSLKFDGKGNLWAGLNSGVDYIWLNLPVLSLFDGQSLGVGYDIANYGNLMFMGTNRGLFYTGYPIHTDGMPLSVGYVKDSGGQVWGIEKAYGDLFCMHDRGLFLVEGTQLKRIGNCAGVWTIQPFKDGSGRFYVGCYDGIYVMDKVNGAWTIMGKINNFYESARYFTQTSPDELWVSTSIKGVVRLKVDLIHYRVESLRVYGIADGIPSLLDLRVENIGGNIYFITSQGVYAYNRKTDKIEKDSRLCMRLMGDKPYSSLYAAGSTLVGFTADACGIASLDGNRSCEVIPFMKGKMEPVRGMEVVRQINDSIYALPNSYGFALFDLGEVAQHQRAIPSRASVSIKSVYITSPRDSLIYKSNYAGKKYCPEIPYQFNSLRFEYGSHDVKERGRLYRCRLRNSGAWSDYSTSLTKEFTSLKEGKYTFEVSSVGNDGVVLTDAFTFVILPPWYRTVWAYLAYIAIAGALVRYALTIERSRVRRKEREAVVEKDRLLHIKEQEYEEENARKERQIVELEKEKLRNELDHKSQEMADLLMNFARKNEILINIKTELQKVFAKLKGDNVGDVKRMILSLNGKIDTNIQSDELLKRIEDQFDMVHNNFMKKLRAAYPALTSNELLMCAYLKMNLSTKEIAPLLNISVRGVETLRYRLRKKINLDAGKSLTEFLNKNFDDGIQEKLN